ncbi:unnamed protein product [Brachionus calyciflorus]|uniref:ETS domain-containing protein n=1 Tax=Brachionus calyciflorus TaxID=104777 RepID=A0A813Y574_9BILA|nr:unnamed protein product [Brachionus calyciflorus]
MFGSYVAPSFDNFTNNQPDTFPYLNYQYPNINSLNPLIDIEPKNFEILDDMNIDEFLNSPENTTLNGSFNQTEFTFYNSNDGSCNSSVYSGPSTPDGFKHEAIEQIDLSLNIFDDVEIKSKNLLIKSKGKICKKPKKKPENMKDCLHVWEFLRDLLKSNEFNGKCIKWLDKERGLFKILSPSDVSNLWGKKKANKEKMDYPNMARGIRYSREEGGYFDLVTKEDGFGKKLVYKFSKKASMHCDWLRSFMV